MIDMNLVMTMVAVVALVAGAALALWMLPWSTASLLEADEDLRRSVSPRHAPGSRSTMELVAS